MKMMNFVEKHVREYAKLRVGVENMAQIFSFDVGFSATSIPPMYSTILFINTLLPCPLSPRLYRKQKTMQKNQKPLKSNVFLSNGFYSPCQNALSPSGSAMITN
jgi:hypothetical protein